MIDNDFLTAINLKPEDPGFFEYRFKAAICLMKFHFWGIENVFSAKNFVINDVFKNIDQLKKLIKIIESNFKEETPEIFVFHIKTEEDVIKLRCENEIEAEEKIKIQKKQIDWANEKKFGCIVDNIKVGSDEGLNTAREIIKLINADKENKARIPKS